MRRWWLHARCKVGSKVVEVAGKVELAADWVVPKVGRVEVGAVAWTEVASNAK